MAKDKWVNEGTRGTCRNCGAQVIFCKPRDTIVRSRSGDQKYPRFTVGAWWHVTPKDWVWDESRYNEDRTKYSDEMACHATPWGPMVARCLANEARLLVGSEGRVRHYEGPSAKAQPFEFCVERTGGGDRWSSSYACHRPVKDEELVMCGLHASHKRREEKKSQEHHQKWEFDRSVREALSEFVEELNDLWDLNADLDTRYSREHGYIYTGKVSVNPGRLREILEEKVEEF